MRVSVPVPVPVPVLLLLLLLLLLLIPAVSCCATDFGSADHAGLAR